MMLPTMMASPEGTGARLAQRDQDAWGGAEGARSLAVQRREGGPARSSGLFPFLMHLLVPPPFKPGSRFEQGYSFRAM